MRDILKAAGTTAILVTHDQHEAFAIADEIGVMKDGAIEQWDSAYNLYHRPRTRFVADFVGQGVFLRGVARERRPDAHRAGRARRRRGRPTCPPAARSTCCCGRTTSCTTTRARGRPKCAAKAFRGAEFLYTLKLASGTRVLSLVPSHHNHAIGEKIGIRLAIDHVVAFPAAAG